MPISFLLAPAYLAEIFGISEDVAGLLLSGFLILALVAPVIILSKDLDDHGISSMSMFVMTLIICVALGWTPAWALIILVIFIGIILWLVVIG